MRPRNCRAAKKVVGGCRAPAEIPKVFSLGEIWICLVKFAVFWVGGCLSGGLCDSDTTVRLRQLKSYPQLEWPQGSLLLTFQAATRHGTWQTAGCVCVCVPLSGLWGGLGARAPHRETHSSRNTDFSTEASLRAKDLGFGPENTVRISCRHRESSPRLFFGVRFFGWMGCCCCGPAPPGQSQKVFRWLCARAVCAIEVRSSTRACKRAEVRAANGRTAAKQSAGVRNASGRRWWVWCGVWVSGCARGVGVGVGRGAHTRTHARSHDCVSRCATISGLSIRAMCISVKWSHTLFDILARAHAAGGWWVPSLSWGLERVVARGAGRAVVLVFQYRSTDVCDHFRLIERVLLCRYAPRVCVFSTFGARTHEATTKRGWSGCWCWC